MEISSRSAPIVKRNETRNEGALSIWRRTRRLDRLIVRYGATLVIVLLIVVGGFGALGFFDERTKLIDGIRTDVARTLQLQVDEETALRGFDVTDARSLLEPYDRAHDGLETLVASLQARLADDPASLKALSGFVELHETWVRDVANPIIANPKDDTNRARLLTGKAPVEAMRSIVASIDRTYAQRFAQTDDLKTAIRITIALAILVAVMLIATNGYYAERRSVELEEKMLRTIIGERDAEARRSEWRTKIIAMLAHDFRSSLSVIRAYAEMLEHFPEKRSDESAYHVIEKTVEDLAAMSEDALLMARVSSSEGLSIKLGPQRIFDVINEAAERYTSEREIRISDSGDLVMGDRPYLIRVFDNLIGNAVKYSPAGSPMEICIARSGERAVEIAVTDHGRGIDPADLPHVFDEYWRAKSSSDHSGSGVGLFIVKKIVDAHGGSTSIESEPGAGTTVRVKLPAALA